MQSVTPTKIADNLATNIVQMAASDDWLFLLTEEGSAAGLHNNVTYTVFDQSKATQIAASKTNLALVTEAGQVWTGDTASLLTEGIKPLEPGEATQSDDAARQNYSFNQVAAASGWFAAVSEGQVYTWSAGEVDLGSIQPIESLPNTTHIAASNDTLVALTADNTVFSWQPGTTPTQLTLDALEGHTPEQVNAGPDSFYMQADGALYAWGENTNGQLGTGATAQPNQPALSVNLWPTAVTFGDTEAAETNPKSRNAIETEVPEQAAGTVDVTVNYALRAGTELADSSIGQILEGAFTYEGSAGAPAMRPMNAPRNGNGTWCDQNPNTFYSLRTDKDFGQANFSATIDRFKVQQGSGGSDPSLALDQADVINFDAWAWHRANQPNMVGGSLREAQSPGVNSLGVSPEGKIYFTSQVGSSFGLVTIRQWVTVFEVDISSGTPGQPRALVKNYGILSRGTGVPGRWGDPFISGGAVDPEDGHFYFSSYSGTKVGEVYPQIDVTIWKVDTSVNNPTPQKLRNFLVQPASHEQSPDGTSGDIAFDAKGNLLVTIGGRTTTVMGTIPASALTATGGAYEVPVSRALTYTNTGEGPAGIAYNPHGYLVWQTDKKDTGPSPAGTGQLLQLRNPVNQHVENSGSGLFSQLTLPRDLGSCATPPTVEVQKHISQRLDGSDQFTVGAGLTTQAATIMTTSGSKVGVQDQKIGPLAVLLTGTADLDIGEMASPGSKTTDLDLYQPTLTCVDQAQGEVPFVDRQPMDLQSNGTHALEDIDIPDPSASSQGPRVLCTVYNDPTAPTKTAAPDSKTHVNPDGTVEYALTFANPPVTASRASIPWYVDYTDYLGDVLDDAELVVTNSSGDETSKYFSGIGDIDALTDTENSSLDVPVLAYDSDIESLRIRGMVDPGKTYEVKFTVRAKANDENYEERRAGAPAEEGSDQASPQPAKVGYVLNNYLQVTASDALPSSCKDSTGQCTTHPIRAWTVGKNSYPTNGEPVHENGRMYYRIEIENFNGGELKDIVVNDDLSRVLWASRWMTEPANAWGVSFYDKDGEEIPGSWLQGVREKTGTQGEQAKQVVIWPEFYCGETAVGNGAWAGWHSAQTEGCEHPVFSTEANEDYTPWDWSWLHRRSEGPYASWKLQTSGFDIPEGAYSAVLGYVVMVGSPAKPGDPVTPTPLPEAFGSGNVPVPPNALTVNVAWAGTATVPSSTGPGGTAQLPSIACNALSSPESPVPGCSSTHRLAESFFHIRKHGIEGGNVKASLPGTELIIADSEEDARTGKASKWLCHVNNSPCQAPANWDGTGDVVVEGTDGKPECVNGARGSISIPGSARDTLGDPNFLEGSVTHAGIQQWNALANVWNAQPENKDDEATVYPACGLFYEHDEDSHDADEAGSWHVQDLHGGLLTGTAPELGQPDDRPLTEQWRGTGIGSDEKTGTYWLSEQKAAPGYQLFAQPQRFWVAPDSPTPQAVQSQPGKWEFFNYQGRVSFPAVGIGEQVPSPGTDEYTKGVLAPPTGVADGAPLLRSVCEGWCEAPCSEEPPANNQPACISKNGWNMQAFNTKTHVLPLSGGLGAWWLIIAGGTLLGAVSGGALWRRRKAQTTSDDLEASASSDPAPGVMQEGEKAGGEPSGPASLQDMVGSGEK